MAESTPSLVKLGCASRILSIDSQSSSLSKIISTVILVPAITGFHIIMFGLLETDASSMIHLSTLDLA